MTDRPLKFSGHETFICKQLWPKKGFDFLMEGNRFSDQDAIVKLGVGKNMVTSIRHWLKSLDIIDTENEQPQNIAKSILSDKNGFDPYLEDIGSIWLLHYFLIKNQYASIYNLLFNEFRKKRFEFTKAQLHNFLKRKILQIQPNSYSKDIIDRDISNFIRNYLSPNDKADKVNIEEDFVGLFIDLHLLDYYKSEEGVEWYKIDSKKRKELPHKIFLYTILDNSEFGNSIVFDDLRIRPNSPGLVFALNNEGIYAMIEELTELYPDINFSKTAGNQVLQLPSGLNKNQILKEYYGK